MKMCDLNIAGTISTDQEKILKLNIKI